MTRNVDASRKGVRRTNQSSGHHVNPCRAILEALPYRRYCLIILCLTLMSCSRVKVSSEVPTPQEFQEVLTQESSDEVVSPLQPWWVSLKSPALDEMMSKVFGHNLQLAQAKERIIQLREVAVQTGSQRWPSANLDLGWSRTKQLNPFSRVSSGPGGPSPAASAFPSSFTQDNFRASIAVSYEVDIWGRISSLTEAAERDAIAAEEELKSLAITLSAMTVDTWLQLIEVEARYTIIGKQLSDDEAQLRVILHRFQQGLSPQIEVLQQTQQRDRTKTQLPNLQAQRQILRRQLAALQGEVVASSLTIPDHLPKLPALPKIGLPGDLLAQRPDIRAAQARLASADARVNAALSAKLPGLRLGVSGGYQSFEIDELFDDIIWSMTGSIITPLFQGGRLEAEQRRTEAVLREQLSALKEKVLTAIHEVENSISAERSATRQLKLTRDQLDSAQRLFDSAQNRYVSGVGDFLTTLTARQGLYSAELATLAAERSQLAARVQLHRSLGGSWPDLLLHERDDHDDP